MQIIKRNGSLVEFDQEKIEKAIAKANAASTSRQLTPEQIEDIASYITYKCTRLDHSPSVEEVQDMVENQLMLSGALEVAKLYIRYRYKRSTERVLNPEEVARNTILLKDVMVQKKNGTVEAYSAKKLLDAVGQSAIRARESGTLTQEEKAMFIAFVEEEIVKKEYKVVPTSVMHMLVEKHLPNVASDVAESYSKYHSYRMSQARLWEQVMGKCTTLISNDQDVTSLTQKQQNANADSTLASTQRCFFADYTSEAYYEQFFLTKQEKQIAEDGYLYWHDKNGRMVYPVNCCLFRMDYILEHGCEVNGIHYNKPKTLSKCFDVMGDLILMTASQQYGGFTVPRIDSIIVPYAEKSYQDYIEKYLALGLSTEKAEAQAYKDIKADLYDGFQGLEIKLNTVASSRGDYPFTTITFGLEQSRFGRLASIAALDTRAGGQGEKGKKKPVLFPKLVFLFDENLHGEGKPMEDVYEAAIHCSSKAMYPDWLSLTGEGYVSSMYKQYGEVISPMGCRAFLSPWYERGGIHPADENDKPVFEGRFNLGVISMNLPMILAKARKDGEDFYDTLDYYLEVIRQNHKRTYEYISHIKASRNPIAFCYGGFYGGNLKPEDEIGPALHTATMSFGITALNELQQLYNGKSIYEDGQFALDVMEHINKRLNEFKEEDHILYAVYGTPAESLCGKQVRQFRRLYGTIKNVSDRDYVSNSFHCHVSEDISPIQKQNSEKRFWNLFNGGKIQYCRYHLNYNEQAIKSLVGRAMDFGFYEGVNLSMDFCDDCGYQQVEMGHKCPKCGGYHITQIDRMNGYLGFTRVGSDTRVEKDKNGNEVVIIHSRYTPHKQAEIKDRVSM